MRKFQAKYRVTVYSKFQTITVNYPITCKFNVSRGLFAQSNKANIQLYNLSLSTRNMIFQDCLVINPDLFKYVRLEAGYNDSMAVIFEGRILQAYSYKSGGQTDVITEIQAQALDVFDCQTSVTFEAGTSFRDAYKKMASDMPNVQFNNLGALEGNFKTSTTFEGNTFDQLNKLTGGHTYVDNNQLNCIMNNEAIKVPVPVINDSSVLLETPRRRDANLQIKMLFEPTLLVGQLLEIGSAVSPNFNGQFKVIGFTHDCLISGTQAGSRTTSVDLFIGPLLPGADINLTGEKIESSTGGAASFNLVEGESISTAILEEPSNIRDVYNYIQKNGIAPHTKITQNIWWDEVLKPKPLTYEKPSIEILSNLYFTASQIQKFRDKYYPGTRIQINSGWRPRAYNNTIGTYKMVNGVKKWVQISDPNSEHIYGNAIDFLIVGYNTNAVYNTFKKYWKGRNYTEGSFIHADSTKSRGVRADW